jgi:hypothetical protein
MEHVYKVVTAKQANDLIKWAEEHNFDWDVYNPIEWVDGKPTELWLEQWPQT